MQNQQGYLWLSSIYIREAYHFIESGETVNDNTPNIGNNIFTYPFLFPYSSYIPDSSGANPTTGSYGLYWAMTKVDPTGARSTTFTNSYLGGSNGSGIEHGIPVRNESDSHLFYS